MTSQQNTLYFKTLVFLPVVSFKGDKNWYYRYSTGRDGDFKFLTTFKRKLLQPAWKRGILDAVTAYRRTYQQPLW